MNYRGLLAAALALAFVCTALPGAAAEPPEGPIVRHAVRADKSPPLRELAKRAEPPAVRSANRAIVHPLPEKVVREGHGEAAGADPLVQLVERPFPFADPTPPPGLVFDGPSDDDNSDIIGFRIVPPDTNGDVGLDHWCSYINLIMECFDKETGASVFGPVAGNTPWIGFGGDCEAENDGDPIVIFDHLAQRWVFTQFAVFVPEGKQCVAVSETSDPTGPYFRYEFIFSASLNDYPKMGLWPDGYYFTHRDFANFEIMAVALNRDKMLVGDPTAEMVAFDHGSLSLFNFDGVLPPHLEGPAPPGTPCAPFIGASDSSFHGDNPVDAYLMWEFCADWDTGGHTYTRLPDVPAGGDFDTFLCDGFGACVPQPSPGELLDSLALFTMYRAQFRSFDAGGGPSTLVVNHSVDVGGNRAGIRWAELRNEGSGWFLFQDGTYAPDDGQNRWMGSIAMDKAGNIGLGYSVSSASTFPSVRYVTRTSDDPLGTLPGGEVEMKAGTGAQTGSANRWGDYSSMSLDPVDDCTFWYTQEYYQNTGSFDFNTVVGNFKLDNCEPGCVLSATVDDRRVERDLPVPPGTVLPIDIVLAHVGTEDAHRRFGINLLGPGKEVIARRVTLPYTFEVNRTMKTRESIEVPADTPPGRYLVVVTLEGMTQGSVVWNQPVRVR